MLRTPFYSTKKIEIDKPDMVIPISKPKIKPKVIINENNNTILSKNIGLVFRKLRKKSCFNMREVSKYSGLEYTTLQETETYRRNPSMRTIITLTKFYNISLSEFFKLVEKKLDKGVIK